MTKHEHNEKNYIGKPKNAIILAAGIGLRMVPINMELPKGLLEVQEEALIERLISQLNEVGIFEIHIVVGFLKEKYEFLIDKYGVNLVYNEDYALKNNLHSLRPVVDKISNTYILPCDVWAKENPFSTEETYSWSSIYDGVDKHSPARMNREGKLVPVEEFKGGNTLVGISYIREEEARILRENIRIYSQDEKYDNSLWEEALFNGEDINIYAKVYDRDEVVEINTYEQLRELDHKSSNLDMSVMTLIANVMDVRTKDIQDIDLLKKGKTNSSFRFTVKGKKYIMRIPGQGTDMLVNRENEYRVYEAIKDIGISDDVIYISGESGYKITKFLENTRACDPYDVKDVKMCIEKLRWFHGQRMEVPHTFDVFGNIDYFEELWEGEPSVFRDYLETKKKVMELKPIIDGIPKDWILTHVDAVPSNYLITEDDVRLIDWEYAGMQDPHLDIAMFAISAMYDREHLDALIDIYFTEGYSEETKMKIYSYMAMGGLLWSNWCEYKRFHGEEFGEYSLNLYRYAKEYYKIVMEEFIKK